MTPTYKICERINQLAVRVVATRLPIEAARRKCQDFNDQTRHPTPTFFIKGEKCS